VISVPAAIKLNNARSLRPSAGNPSPDTLSFAIGAAAFLVLAAVYGMAWWTVKNGRRWARAWAIGASLANILLSAPGFMAIYFARTHSARRMPDLFVFSGIPLALGIAGLAAFASRNALATPVAPPKPDPIPGDGTSRLLDTLALLLAIAGVIAGMSLYMRWGHAQHLPIVHGYVNWLQLALAILFTIAAHEFGHAAVGIALGMKLRGFIVGPLQWRIRDGKWRFQFLPAKFFSAGGATSVVPTDPNQSHWREICMIAAGPLASLFTGLIALVVMLTAKGRPYEQGWEFLAQVATFSLIGFVTNLIPVRPEALYSDGAQIYQLLRGGPWADLHRVIGIAGSTLVTPLRPRDFDIEAIQRAEGSFTRGRPALILRLTAAEYFLDSGKFPESLQALAEAESIYLESASDIPAELHTALIFLSAFLSRNPADARLWWERMEAKKPTYFGVDYWLARSALLWVENRPAEAREAWEKVHALAQQLPAAGSYEFDRYRVTLLRGVLDAAPAISQAAPDSPDVRSRLVQTASRITPSPLQAE